MIFKDGECWEHKRNRLLSWHRKFVIIPRCVGVDDNGRKIMACLTTIWRQGDYHHYWSGYGWTWEYSVNKPE